MSDQPTPQGGQPNGWDRSGPPGSSAPGGYPPPPSQPGGPSYPPPPGGYPGSSGGYPPAADGPGGPDRPGGYPAPAGGYPPPGGSSNGDDRTIAVIAHLSPLIAMILSAGWLSFVGPLLVWFLYRDRSHLVRNASASAFNFNITVWVATIAGWICLFTVILIPLTIILWIGAFVLQVVLSIIGAMRASRGEVYRYPMQVPILS